MLYLYISVIYPVIPLAIIAMYIGENLLIIHINVSNLNVSVWNDSGEYA